MANRLPNHWSRNPKLGGEVTLIGKAIARLQSSFADPLQKYLDDVIGTAHFWGGRSAGGITRGGARQRRLLGPMLR
ncbi:hypothetical protein [Mycolicibacterium sp. 624]|uniref:hypothetical protein n=1 Tax=Mycolicibacterium sp. 624 TaxID=3156314 RepID=UPI003395A433